MDRLARRPRLALAAALALALLLPQTLVAQEADDRRYRPFPYLLVAGDLDGDGLDDTVSRGSVPEIEVPEVGVVWRGHEVIARDGFDGSTLWELPELASALLPAPLGTGADPGVLIVNGLWTFTGGGGGCSCGQAYGERVEARELTLRAVDGAGETIWDRAFDAGVFAGAAFADEQDGRRQAVVAERFPTLSALVQAAPGAATDALVSVLTRRETPDEITTTIEAVVVDGATGETASSFTVETEGARSALHAAGDLDGDGLDDVVILREPDAGGLTARSGIDGSVLWSNPGDVVPFNVVVGNLGDVTGDGIDDLAVGGTGDVFDETPPRVSVLDGATGSVLFTTDTAVVSVAGPIDQDGTVGLLTQRVVTEPERAVRYRLLTAAGELVAERSVPVPEVEGQSTGVLFIRGAGDLDGDGVADLGHQRTTHTHDGGSLYEGTVVSGRTLAPLFQGLAGAPLLASLDGGGDDLVLVRRPSAGVWRVAAQDGASGAELWSASLAADPAYPRTGRVSAAAAEVDGDGVPDVVLTLESSRWVDGTTGGSSTESIMQSWVLSGADGTVLWSV